MRRPGLRTGSSSRRDEPAGPRSYIPILNTIMPAGVSACSLYRNSRVFTARYKRNCYYHDTRNVSFPKFSKIQNFEKFYIRQIKLVKFICIYVKIFRIQASFLQFRIFFFENYRNPNVKRSLSYLGGKRNPWIKYLCCRAKRIFPALNSATRVRKRIRILGQIVCT